MHMEVIIGLRFCPFCRKYKNYVGYLSYQHNNRMFFCDRCGYNDKESYWWDIKHFFERVF